MPSTLQRVTSARSRLILQSPWLGSLSLRLQVVEDASVPSWETDGTSLHVNPEWTEQKSDHELLTLWAHETWHCALLHPYQMQEGNRDQGRANRAMDYVVNLLIQGDGLHLPGDALIDQRFAGLDWRKVYAILEAEEQKPNAPQPPPAPAGGVQPAGDETGGTEDGDGTENGQAPGTPKAAGMTADDWTDAAEQATLVGQRAGTMAGDSARAIRQTHQTKTPWFELLREFVTNTVPSDFSMKRPNRQYASRGLYVPGLVKENAPPFVLGVDTSGSITQQMLDAVASEVQALMREVRPESITVIYCDAEVQHVETFEPDDDIKLSVHGGGGTLFQPVFDYVGTMEEPPAALIYFTDLMGPAPSEPDYPVLWLVPEAYAQPAFFGETVPFRLYD